MITYKYNPTIGIEVHVELNTKSKMFCSCLNDPDEKNPNLNICSICTAQPGTLPVINQEAVKKTIKIGLALNCQIEENSFFERKNYFYPDLPKGYQISQYQTPFCKNGFLEINGKKIRIKRIHLEEDTARLIHEKDCSLVDFNRAGIPLMELVTEPDLNSAKEARDFAKELHLIMHYLNISDADMEKGQMRVEVNISLSKEKEKLGTKVEIKNLNSFRVVERSIEYEIERQIKLLEQGKKIIQETRGWENTKEITVSQREKEEAHDYRYFPEPDLPPLSIFSETINEIRSQIPELPHERRERLKREYKLDEKSAEFFVYNKNLGEYFEKTISELPPNLSRENLVKLIKLTSNYIITDLQRLLKEELMIGKDFLITPENFAEFITLIYQEEISSKIAKQVLEEMFKTGADPSHIIEEKNLIEIIDEKEIEKIIKEIILKNEKAVEDFKKGKENAFQFLIGQVMAKTQGKASLEITNNLLKKFLLNINS